MIPPPLTHAEISHRARELWLARGSPVGCDLEIWLAAERSLIAEQAATPTPTARRGSRSGVADEIDEDKLADRLNDFGEAARPSVTSAQVD